MSDTPLCLLLLLLHHSNSFPLRTARRAAPMALARVAVATVAAVSDDRRVTRRVRGRLKLDRAAGDS